MIEKMDSIVYNQTWQLIELLTRKRPIITKWVYKMKTYSIGKPSKYKVRLMTKGNKLKKDLDF
jgi:hypothetical protein